MTTTTTNRVITAPETIGRLAQLDAATEIQLTDEQKGDFLDYHAEVMKEHDEHKHSKFDDWILGAGQQVRGHKRTGTHRKLKTQVSEDTVSRTVERKEVLPPVNKRVRYIVKRELLDFNDNLRRWKRLISLQGEGRIEIRLPSVNGRDYNPLWFTARRWEVFNKVNPRLVMRVAHQETVEGFLSDVSPVHRNTCDIYRRAANRSIPRALNQESGGKLYAQFEDGYDTPEERRIAKAERRERMAIAETIMACGDKLDRRIARGMLHGTTQAEMAREQGVDQATISRRSQRVGKILAEIVSSQ